jgi:hypothetical protein
MVASEDQTAVSHVAVKANDGDASAGSARHVQDGVGVLGGPGHLSAVDDQVVIVGHAVNSHRTE